MARRLLIALLACSTLTAPAVGNVSRCARPTAAKAAGCCCRVASEVAENDCCQPQAKSCCRRVAADEGTSHRCFCKSNRPQPAIPTEQRDESRGQPILAASVCGQVPVMPVEETRPARSIRDSTADLTARQALLCRWLI